MSNVESILKELEVYVDDRFDVELLSEMRKKPAEEAYSIADIINEENENFINESGLDRIFEVEDKEIQKKLLRKIMYITYLNGLGEDAQTMALKCIIKMIGNKM
jgi:hypothetical protein